MYWPNVPLIAPYLLAGLISLALARYIWRRRPAPGAAALTVAMLLVADWSLFAGFALAGATLPLQLLGDKLANPGVAGVSGAFLAFVFGYTGRAHWINRYTLVLLALEP